MPFGISLKKENNNVPVSMRNLLAFFRYDAILKRSIELFQKVWNWRVQA